MSANVNKNTVFPAEKGIMDLPVEVISHIFSYLTIIDIQQARLVCPLWYLASQAPALLEQEKVVPCKEYGCESPDLLLKSNRRFLNLSLMDINRRTVWYSDNFWSQFGPTLRSLCLCYCDIREDQLLRVLSHCKQLRSLEINECEFLFCSDSQATNRIYKNITPKLLKLQSLKIANILDPSCALFDKLVDSAPNLTTLSLDDCLVLATDLKTWKKKPALTFKHVVEYLRDKPHHINSLHITCCEEEGAEVIVAAAMLPNLLLKRFQTDRYQTDVAAVLSCQIWLQEIDLHCDATNSLLQTICVNLTELRRLTLNYCSVVTHTGMLALLMLKKLTSLKLLQCCKVSGEAILESLCNGVNTTLRELALTELTIVSHLHIVVLAKAHPALTHLDLSRSVGVTDWSVQAIFRYQKSLHSLILSDCPNLTDRGLLGVKMTSPIHNKNILFGGTLVCQYLVRLKCSNRKGVVNPTGCGISELKYLEKLDLSGSCDISRECIIRELRLPAIRHLILDQSRLSAEAFKGLFDKNRTIESLELSNCCGVTNDLIFVIVEKLKRLKRIDLEDCRGVSQRSINFLKRHCKRVKT